MERRDKHNYYLDIATTVLERGTCLRRNYGSIIVKNDDKYNEISDLKGTSFVFGAAGSATEVESRLVLEAHGITGEDIKANYVGFTEATDLMRNGQVEGVNIYTE